MRDREEIKNKGGMQIKKEGVDGFGGTYYQTVNRRGKNITFSDPLNFIFSNGCRLGTFKRINTYTLPNMG